MRLIHNEEVNQTERDGVKQIFMYFPSIDRIFLKGNEQAQKYIDQIKPHCRHDPDEGRRS